MSNRRFTRAIIPVALACVLPAWGGQVIQSDFNSGEEGWTQVDIGSDFRYGSEIAPEDCSAAPSNDLGPGVLTFCDPDAGAWMYQAPAKFLGDQSGMFGGRLKFQLRYLAVEPLVDYPENADPNVVVASGDTAIVSLNAIDPTPAEWNTFDFGLDESGGWLWVDESTAMEDLPRATAAQIQQVLKSVTALRILGEFITGEDRGFLDNVILSSPVDLDRPRLSIRPVQAGKLELSWTASANDFALESADSLSPTILWTTIDTTGETTVLVDASSPSRFFRLRKR